MKFRDKLTGEVVGTDRYKTEVDLDNLGSKCSCPYGTNCKHGAAVLLQYFNGEYIDGDEVMKKVEGMSREELKGAIDRLISMNPTNLFCLSAIPVEKKTSEKRLAALDKEIKSRLNRIEYTSEDAGFVDDFAKLKKLRGEDNYEMLDTFFNRIAAVENSKKLADFEGYIHEFLDERSYVEFLINCGLIDKARGLIEAWDSLGDETRFRSYLRIDKDNAIEFARRKEAYSSLIRYYHEIGAHDEAVGLFKEVVSDEAKREQLKHDLYLYRDIFDSINKSEKKERLEEVLRSLFEVCYSLKYYGLCLDAGIKLGNKELMRKLIGQKRGYDFDVEAKIKLLDYLKGDYKEEVEKELKELAKSLIEEKKNYAYEKATECVFLLRKLISKEEWENYVKELYNVHSRKMNLWIKFTRRGVNLKKKIGVVTIEESGYGTAKRR